MTWAERHFERRLFFWVLVAIGAAFCALLTRTDSGFDTTVADGFPAALVPWLPWIPFAGFAVALCLTHILLAIAGFRGDPVLTAMVGLLMGIGILVQTRIGVLTFGTEIKPSSLAFPIGVVLMWVTVFLFRRGRYHILRSWTLPAALGSLALVGFVLATGQRYRGAIYAAGNMTPTELLKVLVVLFTAGYITRHQSDFTDGERWLPRPRWRVMIPLMFFWTILSGLILVQRDLGMILILCIALAVMLYIGTGRLAYPLAGGALGIAAGAALLSRFSHGQQRIDAWLSPFSDATGSGWQVLQALSGLYAGGLWGAGLGKGNPERIPIVESDFIYAAIGEEFGFAGCVLLVFVYLTLFRRGYRVAGLCADPFGRLLAAGLVTVVAAQTLLNIGGVTKFLPLTGITLPFISHGGSSLITSFIILGIVIAISEPDPNTKRAVNTRSRKRSVTKETGRSKRTGQTKGKGQSTRKTGARGSKRSTR